MYLQTITATHKTNAFPISMADATDDVLTTFGIGFPQLSPNLWTDKPSYPSKDSGTTRSESFTLATSFPPQRAVQGEQRIARIGLFAILAILSSSIDKQSRGSILRPAKTMQQ